MSKLKGTRRRFKKGTVFGRPQREVFTGGYTAHVKREHGSAGFEPDGTIKKSVKEADAKGRHGEKARLQAQQLLNLEESKAKGR